ncbi:MAG TPA: hypothetical protein VGR31_05490 [Planctomycetota bacterium]|nr:hypothetical protein [Planctomycetota bacterium]
MRIHSACVLSCLALAACRTSTTSHVPGPASIAITQATPVRAWELWESGRCLGAFVRFEEHGNTERAFYSVRNREGQELGIVDLDGRAWRYRAHASEPEWLGSGTVIDGARRILGGTTAATSVEVDVHRLQEILGGS